MEKHIWYFIFLQLFGLVLSQGALPKLNIDRDYISVSGYSGGAFFAPQFHTAFSANISGSASWSGWPNLCITDLECLEDPANYDVTPLVEITLQLADSGQIDPVSNLERGRVYLFHGSLDDLVDPELSQRMADFFEAFMPSEQIRVVDNIPALHAVVSDNYGSPCGVANFLMYHALDHMSGGGLTPSTHVFDESNFVDFDQNIYYTIDGGDAYSAAMGDVGYIFIPPRCQDSTVACKLHVYFHGCGMNVPIWGYDTWLRMVSGFFDVGTTNDVVMLFPQTTSEHNLDDGETDDFFEAWGCWNVDGYLDDREGYKFATKEAPQMKGIFRMIEALVG